jgi:glutathione synthase/RimK-type ligase-like ATP-grasp enzyme
MRLALVTCPPDPAYDDELLGVDDALKAALRARGATVEAPVWSDPDVDWSSYDLAFVRTTWDYPAARDAFVAWAAATARVTSVWNPPDVLRWNTHKSYLLELEERGAPVVPTAWLGRGDRVPLEELLASRGWTRAVVKPAVAAGSEGLVRVAVEGGEPDPSDATGAPGTADLAAGQRHLDALLAVGDVMVQPYLDSIEVAGELSVVVIDGEVSHAVRKVPPAGEFRIQSHYGGRYVAEPVDAEVAALARWIVEATGADLVAARVDLLAADDGALQLAELEATEPDLYLGVVPEAAERLADAVVARVAGTRR